VRQPLDASLDRVVVVGSPAVKRHAHDVRGARPAPRLTLVDVVSQIPKPIVVVLRDASCDDPR
jgi:hypothetical protein